MATYKTTTSYVHTYMGTYFVLISGLGSGHPIFHGQLKKIKQISEDYVSETAQHFV